MSALQTSEWTSEAAFVGALMHLPTVRVIEAATLVRGADFDDPRLAMLFGIAVELAAQGIQPDPVRIHGYALTSGLVPMSRHPELVGLAVDLYTHVPHPSYVESYARSVVERAARRRLVAMAERLGTAAGTSDLSTLIELTESETATVLEGFRRLSAAPMAGAA